MSQNHPFLIVALILTACSGGVGQNLGTSDPMRMSEATLCFRYASSKAPDLAAAIDARDIDCTRILEDDPLYNRGRAADEGSRTFNSVP